MSNNPYGQYSSQTQKPNDNSTHAFPYMQTIADSQIGSKAFIPKVANAQQETVLPKDQMIESSKLGKLGQTQIARISSELDDAFAADETYNPFIERAVAVRKAAEQFLHVIKTKFPNRYFISKRITQSPEIWEICLQKNLVIINDENYIRKLQNCFEVIVFPLPLITLVTFIN